jgi:TRAP-type C4-dicarboxylate transport system permease small subunit
MFGNRSEGRIAHVLEGFGAFCLVILMLTVFIDVLGRNVLNMPLPWGTEVLEIVLAAMIFALYPVLALTFGHITVDLIPMPAALRRVQRTLGAAMGVVLFALIAWCLWRQTLRAAGYGESTPLLHVPIAWLLGGMAVLSVATAVAFAYATWQAAARPAPEKPRAAEGPLVTEVI